MEKEKSCGLPFLGRSSRVTDVHILPALGSSASSTDERLTQVGYDEKVTVKEMHSDINESALIWKIDLRIVPVVCLIYLFAFLDRVNIANASVYGMGEELGLVGNQYNVALTIL